MKLKLPLVCLSLVLSFLSMAQKDSKTKSLMKDAQAAKDSFISKDDGMSDFFNSSAGYAIFPNVGKGGLGVGGASGQGIVYVGGQAIGSAKMTQVTIGLQAGGQAYREVIFFETAEQLSRFKENKVELSAQVSAVAAAEGASKDAKYNEGVAVFTMAKKGLMYEASVGGQKFSFTPFSE